MTIINHTTGQQISPRALRLQYPSICAPENPLLGTPGYRTGWADKDAPTDAELRLIGHSLVVEVERPPGGIAAPPQKIGDQWVQQWTVPSDEELRATIIAQIKQTAAEHILAVLPQWKQSNYTARAVELAEIRESREMTADESAQHQALHGAWAWVRSVRTASDLAEADVAAMSRAELDAWVMPELPAWPT